MKADFVLDYNVIAVERAQHVYLMARIQAEAAPDAADRHPLNLSVVLDRSGSMQGNKLAYVKQAAQFLVRVLLGRPKHSDDARQVWLPVIHRPQKHIAHGADAKPAAALIPHQVLDQLFTVHGWVLSSSVHP